MITKFLLLVFLLEFLGVESRPQIASFALLQGSSSWGIGEPRYLPELSDVLDLALPQHPESLKSAEFTYCNKILTLVPGEVFTLTLPGDRKSCLVYLRAPKGYVMEQRSHPIVRISSCNMEQLRFSSYQSSLVYCSGGYPIHFPSEQDYIGVMYESASSEYRQVIQFAVGVKPVDSSLSGSSERSATGISQILWIDPEAEYEHKTPLHLARLDKNLQICPNNCGASSKDAAYSQVTSTTLEEGELPYMVRVAVHYVPLGYSKVIKVNCGGTILNSRSVLTAAHCVLDKDKKGWEVVAKRVYTGISGRILGQELKFDEFVVHPEYRARMSDDYTKSYRAYDIAVLKLEGHIKLGPYSWPICLSPGLDFINKHAMVSGHGRLTFNKLKPWKAGVVIADYDKKCRDLDRFRLPENDYRKVCSFGMSKESCIGDTGSALAVSEDSVWYQVGVATGGFCGLIGEPHFHVNVTTFGDFIRQNVRSGKCN